MHKNVNERGKDIGNYWKFLCYVYKEEPGFVWFSVIATIMNNTTAFADIVFLKYLLDEITRTQVARIVVVVILYGIYLLVVPGVTNYIAIRKLPVLQQRLVFSMKKNIFSNTEKVELEYFDDRAFLDATTLALQTVETHGLGIVESVSTFISVLLNISVLAAIVSTVNPMLFLMSVCMAIVTYHYSVKQSEQDLVKSEKLTPLYRKNYYYQSVFTQKRCAKELRIYQAFPLFENLFEDNSKKCMKIVGNQGKITCSFLLKSKIICTLLNCSIIIYLVYNAVAQRITMGEMVAALAGAQQLSVQLIGFTSAVASVNRYGMVFSKYKETILPQKDQNINGLEKNISCLEFHNVGFKYKRCDDWVLTDVCFSVKKGMSIAFVGENGAGKTTLMNLLCGFYAPTKGYISVNGELVRDRGLLKSNCVAVFQDYTIFNMSIAENVLMRPFLDEVNDTTIVTNALKFSGLLKRISRCKNGIHTIVSKEFSEDGIVLSEGEKQRLAIARVYVQNKPIIILDETTSSLDYMSEKDMVSRFNKRFENSIIIWVTHRPECLKGVDNIYYLEHGNIQEHGKYSELVCGNGKLNRMYQ